MKVHIEGNIYLESDERQFVIKEYSGKQDKNGNDMYTTHAYVTSLEHAFRFILRQKIKESTAKDIKELMEDVKRIEAYVKETLSIDLNGIKEAI